MAEIRVTISELKAKAETLREYNTQFKGQIDGLKTEEETVCSMWEGEAKTKFDNQFKENYEKFVKFYELVNTYCEGMIQIANKYSEAEDYNVSIAGTQ